MAFLISAKWAWVALKFILQRREELKKIRRKGFVVVVTGGSTSGLGAATVRAVCDRLSKIQSHGAHTVIITSKNAEEGILCLEELRHPTVHVGFHKLDPNNSKSLEAFTQNMKDRFETIDILISNIDMLPSSNILSWKCNTDYILGTDYYEAKFVILALMPLMALGGRIVIGASSLAELAIRWMNEDAFVSLFNPAATEKDLDGVANSFFDELYSAAPGNRRVYDAMAYPFAQATRIALAQYLGNQLKQTSPDTNARITVCAFSTSWCRTPTEGNRAPFSATEGAEETMFAAFDANPEEIQGAYLIGRKPARFGDAVAAIEAEYALSRSTSAEDNNDTRFKYLARQSLLSPQDFPHVWGVGDALE